MGYMVVTIWFPPHKGAEVGKKAIEIMKKFPEDKSIGKTILNGALMRTELGIKGITITDIKDGQLEAAFDRANAMLQVYSEIEGLNSTIETMASLAESLEMVGLKAPE